MDMQTPIIISIEGNIGSGKSTLVDNLKQVYRNSTDIYFLEEPVDMWNTITDNDNKTILENYYEDQDKYAFPFQMMAYISRISILKKAIKTSNAKVIITERCVYTDSNVFAKMLFDTNKIGPIEYKIYKKWFDEFTEDMPINHIIYVKAHPTTAFERVIKRNRQGETIPLQYLQTCHHYHEEWLISSSDLSILTLDGDIDVVDEPDITLKWLNEIRTFINKSLPQGEFIENEMSKRLQNDIVHKKNNTFEHKYTDELIKNMEYEI